MTNFFYENRKLTGAAAGALAFGIELYTSPAVFQFAATIGSYMSSFIGAVPALFGGLAITAGLNILAGVLLALAISSLFAKKAQVEAKVEPTVEPTVDQPTVEGPKA